MAAPNDRYAAVGREADEPAAMLFAFITHGRSLPRAWRKIAVILAENQAARIGRALHLPEQDVDELFSSVTNGDTSYDEVRTWIAEYVAPR